MSRQDDLSVGAYAPQSRPAKGLNPSFASHMSIVCDVCGKSRAHYRHEKCSRIRQAAGFDIRQRGPVAGKECKLCVSTLKPKN